MKTLKIVQFLTGVSLALCLPASSPLAEDTKGKWQFGFGLSYFSTTDYIRSNSDLAVSGGVVDDSGLPNVGSVDERPDINMLNEASIRDDFKLDFSASYGLTRWLAVEVAASYLKAPVGNIEYYTENKEQDLVGLGSVDPTRACGPSQDDNCYRYTTQTSTQEKSNKFLPIGELTEIPIHASALVRFRPESPLDPYIGIGFGYIMTDLKTGEEFNRKARQLGSLNVSTACEGEYTLQSCALPEDSNRNGILDVGEDRDEDGRLDSGAGKANFTPTPLEANVKNAFEFHTVGGVDYYLSERFSFYVDARYVWTSGSVDIRTDGAHQVRFAVVDPGQLFLLRRDFQDESDPSKGPYLWEDIGIRNDAGQPISCSYTNGAGQSVNCAGDKFYQTEDKNVNGTLDPQLAGGSEDNGILYVLPPGSRDVNERISEITCPTCNGNNRLDTEDRNGNQMMDRFLLYGIDICTTDQWQTLPSRCTIRTNSSPQYVWPEGCPQFQSQVAITPKTSAIQAESGCPAFPSGQLSTTSGTDNAPDLFLVQGGQIRLGGFSLGLGVKFTF